MNKRLFYTAFAIGFLSGIPFAAVDGTTGTPLGGIGAGGIRFCGHQGIFYAAEQCPLAWKNFSPISGSCFQLYTNRGGTVQTSEKLKAVQNNGRADDDALYPVYTANLGVTNNVAVTLTAFSPMCFDSVDLMCYPYAFFEITLANTASTQVDVAVAMQIGTASAPAWVAGKGIKTTGGVERALYAASSSSGATVSAGSDNGFLTSGLCNNTISGVTNKVAVKLTLAANALGTVKFVYAWYYGPDPNRYYYTNAFSNAGSVAETGLFQFDRFKVNATRIATRMRASNVPDWIRDHTLNSLCNLTTNSIYTKDGRHCYTEGQWGINGTMDQMWHARFAMTMTVPDLVWQELRWWARTQKVDPAGQIHHDMGGTMDKLWGWDDQQHSEYGYQPNCDKWVDLNAAFIISTYEAFIATGNRPQLDFLWPYVKKAAQRILNQLKEYGNKTYPYTFDNTLNSYDIPGINPNIFNATITTPAYKIMTIFADIYNDNTLKQTCQNAFDTVKISFKKRYLTNNFPSGRYVEGQLAGQWVSFFLRFGHIYSKEDIDSGVNTMDAYYKPLTKGIGFPSGSYDEWTPYLVSHYGGLCLQTGRFDQWKGLQHDWYERYYLNRNFVFNQQLGIPPKVSSPTYLADSASVYNQYISIPVLWRNYYTLLGYQRNKVTGELWIEPMIPPEMNHSLQNGFFFSPEGNGTISATESGTGFADQLIVFKPDKPLQVGTIYLHDKSTDPLVTVRINNAAKPAARIGEGYAKQLKIDYSGTVDTSGVTISVRYGVVGIGNGCESATAATPHNAMFVSAGEKLFLRHNFAGRSAVISVYDIMGRLLNKKTVTNGAVDLQKDFGLSKGCYLVKLTVR